MRAFGGGGTDLKVTWNELGRPPKAASARAPPATTCDHLRPWATPSVELARCGGNQLHGGRQDLAPRLAGVFRARRDDWAGADGLKRRQAEKCREIGWYTARLLRSPQQAFLRGKIVVIAHAI